MSWTVATTTTTTTTTRLRGALALALGLAALGPATVALAAEAYEATATTTLAVTAPATLTQTWSVDCAAIDGVAGAAIAPAGKDLRFVESRDEALAVGVDTTPRALPAAGDSYVYDDVVGARVFARFVVRCGTEAIFDEVILDSNPVVTAPAVEGPFAVRRTDTFAELDLGAIPAGVEVELVDLAVRANPRGAERVTIDIVDSAGVDLAPDLEIGAADVGDVGAGSVVLSPRFTANALGALVVEARFFGEVSAPLVMTVVPDDGSGEPDDLEPGDGASSAGCQAAGAPAPVLGGVLLLGALRRRRRQPMQRA